MLSVLNLVAVLNACAQSPEPIQIRAWKGSIESILRPVAGVERIHTATVPMVRLGTPQRLVEDSFRIAIGIAKQGSDIFVLDAGRDPHVSQVDAPSAHTVRRFVAHIDVNDDTVAPVALGIRGSFDTTELLLLDGRGKRLIASNLADRSKRPPLRYYDLRGVLAQSDNPTSLSIAAWGVSIAGTMTHGTQFAYSPDAMHWTMWRDTTPLRYGLPNESFLRGIATANLVVMAPHQRTIVLPGRYHRTLSIVDIESAMVRRLEFDAGDGPPASLRLETDSSVRIVWRNDARLHFVAAVPSRSFVALVDCDCRIDQADSTHERRQVWLLKWDGRPLVRLVAPRAIMAVLISQDERTLIATVRDSGWERLVEWKLPPAVIELLGRGRQQTQ